MKSCSAIGFAIATIFSYPSIIVHNNKTLEKKTEDFLTLLKKYSPDISALIHNEKTKGKVVKETLETTTTKSYIDDEGIWRDEEYTKKSPYNKWVKGSVSYYLIIPEIEKLVENNSELNQEVQKLALSLTNANPDNNLSYNLSSVAQYYSRFHVGITDNGLDIAEDVYIKSLELIDLENLDQYIRKYNQIGITLLFLADIYFKQEKSKQAKDFYIECCLYNQKPYADIALEKVVSLGGYKAPKIYKERLNIIFIALLILVFSPLIYKILMILPIVPIVIILIIMGAVFNDDIGKWGIKYGKEKTIRTTLHRVYKVIKKWNIN